MKLGDWMNKVSKDVKLAYRDHLLKKSGVAFWPSGPGNASNPGT